ncbi:hypothetical protein BESB_078960 [Besnoitia besnoiti]|uniref:Tetratricopeptide repeat-containing protein n=1 Tax=Besnoitia besnoiti TaxID=94643 RepID=A0A2A9ME69_BESBE|nr:hypothetical protein BESB_078960 [Besnoitia besnoiti]PFH33680.1 hypothetical protein BESB_078960 [Besnoitia besnoiti]
MTFFEMDQDEQGCDKDGEEAKADSFDGSSANREADDGPTKSSWGTWEENERQNREAYRQIRRQYLDARMHGAYEDMLTLGELLYSVAHPCVSPAPSVSFPVAVSCEACSPSRREFAPAQLQEPRGGEGGEGDTRAKSARRLRRRADEAVRDREAEEDAQEDAQREAAAGAHKPDEGSRCRIEEESLFFFAEALVACKQLQKAQDLLIERHRELTAGEPSLLALAANILLQADAPADCVALLESYAPAWRTPDNAFRGTLDLVLATALQRLGRSAGALDVLCAFYRREPLQPKVLFALFGSGLLTPDEELRLLRDTCFSESQMWAKHLAVALISASRNEPPESLWKTLNGFPCAARSSSSRAPRPPGLSAAPLTIGAGGCCLRVSDALSYVEAMYPAQHIPPEILYSSVNLTIQAVRAFRRRNAPLAFALATLLLETTLAEALYVLPVYVACCVQLEKVAELHLLAERLEEALEGSSLDAERTALTAALIFAEGSLLLVEGTVTKAVEVLKKARDLPREPLTTPCLLPLGLALAESLCASAPGDPVKPREKAAREKSARAVLRNLAIIFRGNARVQLCLARELRQSLAPAVSLFSPERFEELCLVRTALSLDRRNPATLHECALIAFSEGSFQETLVLANRALLECTYTAETGPLCTPESRAETAGREDKRENENVCGSDVTRGHAADREAADALHKRTFLSSISSQVPPCCFAPDLVHALRGQALLALAQKTLAGE